MSARADEPPRVRPRRALLPRRRARPGPRAASPSRSCWSASTTCAPPTGSTWRCSTTSRATCSTACSACRCSSPPARWPPPHDRAAGGHARRAPRAPTPGPPAQGRSPARRTVDQGADPAGRGRGLRRPGLRRRQPGRDRRRRRRHDGRRVQPLPWQARAAARRGDVDARRHRPAAAARPGRRSGGVARLDDTGCWRRTRPSCAR